MRIYRDQTELPECFRAAAMVLGNFDGVHLGHAALIQQARALSDRVGVLTFSPHPRLVVQPAVAPFLITPGGARMAALAHLGVDFCIEVTFDLALAAMPAEVFVSGIVANTNARHLVFGQDFRFGHKRGGDSALLKRLESRHGFTTHAVAPVLDDNGERYSSSAVRAFLRAGDVEGATRCLGRRWMLDIGPHALSAHDGTNLVFRFGPCLKPAGGFYSVQLEGAATGDAVLRVEEGDDLGRLHLTDGSMNHGQSLRLAFQGYLGPARGAEASRSRRDAQPVAQ
jgi:riboflavin kinase/FMN adenylyltransferase